MKMTGFNNVALVAAALVQISLRLGLPPCAWSDVEPKVFMARVARMLERKRAN